MENIAAKKFNYDHVSSYKTRGRLGASNRNVRVQRANENRHLSRMDEVSKRRRMPLSPLAAENVVDTTNSEIEAKKGEQALSIAGPHQLLLVAFFNLLSKINLYVYMYVCINSIWHGDLKQIMQVTLFS